MVLYEKSSVCSISKVGLFRFVFEILRVSVQKIFFRVHLLKVNLMSNTLVSAISRVSMVSLVKFFLWSSSNSILGVWCRVLWLMTYSLMSFIWS